MILIIDWPPGLSHFLAVIDPKTAFASIKVTGASENSAQFDWGVPADLPYLEGHFPGYPVVPAVGIVDATIEGLRRALKVERADLRAISSAKFLSPFTPGQVLSATGSVKSGSEWIVEWKDGTSGAAVAVLHLTLDIDNALHT